MAAICRNVCRAYPKLRIFSSTSVQEILPCFSTLSTVCNRETYSLNSRLQTISKRQCSNKSDKKEMPSAREKLMQFFDEEKNWQVDEIKVGRAWTTDDLRIKSNEDLHKLWFVLLKERNMLLTMEHACKEAVELFPNPERIDKVKESMENLETVVRERNKAYFELETGEKGERPTKLEHNQLGMQFLYRMSEHFIPEQMNTKWQKDHKFGYTGRAVHKFLNLYREKLNGRARAKHWRDVRRVQQLFKHFPNVDVEAIKKHYPDVDIERARSDVRAHGNHGHNT